VERTDTFERISRTTGVEEVTMVFLRALVLSLALLGLPAAALADIIVLDFETLADGEAVTTQFTGVTMTGATALTAGVTLNEFEFPPNSGGNVVFDDGAPMTISFALAQPVIRVGGFFTYLAPVTLTAYDATNAVVGSVTSTFFSNLALSGDPGSAPNEFLGLSFAGGIASVTLSGDAFGGSFTLDDFTYETPAAGVPEPGTLASLLLGLGAVATFRRRG
jgi:hypothetical protein